jgi:flagellar basal-body rod protein FlgB
VSLEVEMIKVADTQAQYAAAANIYAKAVSMMRTAIGH